MFEETPEGQTNYDPIAEAKARQLTPDTERVTPIYKYGVTEIVKKPQNGEEHTPDTEWEIVQDGIIKNAVLRDKVEEVIKRNCTSWSKNLQNEMSHLFYQTLEKTITSRDTYWKERVREEIYSHFSWCRECAEGATCEDALAIKDNLK